MKILATRFRVPARANLFASEPLRPTPTTFSFFRWAPACAALRRAQTRPRAFSSPPLRGERFFHSACLLHQSNRRVSPRGGHHGCAGPRWLARTRVPAPRPADSDMHFSPKKVKEVAASPTSRCCATTLHLDPTRTHTGPMRRRTGPVLDLPVCVSGR